MNVIFVGVVLLLLYAGAQKKKIILNNPGVIAARVRTYEVDILSYSSFHNIPVSLTKAVISVESAGEPKAKGSAGEIGLMQMKQVALDDVQKLYNYGILEVEELEIPWKSIKTGTGYLAILKDSLETWDKAITAYNIGIGNLIAGKSMMAGKEYLNKVSAWREYYQ